MRPKLCGNGFLATELRSMVTVLESFTNLNLVIFFLCLRQVVPASSTTCNLFGLITQFRRLETPHGISFAHLQLRKDEIIIIIIITINVYLDL